MFRPIILSLALIPVSIVAQDFRATLQGQITDPSGAAVPDVLVKATQQGTNALREVRSTSDGVYTIPYLDPGTYDVEAIAPGFQTVRRSNITLRVSDKVNLGFQLTVGQVTQEVTITAQQEVLETASADRGLVFDALKTREYPLNGRQTYMLLALTPGVVFTQEQFGASGFSGTRGWDVNSNYKINGARTGQNLFLLNGAPISDQNGMWQLAPNVEAVEEFKVMTNTYDASYGRFGGGVVNTTLRSGSNEWHGNVFEFFRNRVFDANSFQNNLTGAPRGFHNQHQFGGVVGGPIRKDKDMVFFSFEGWQEVVPFPALSSVPPTLLRDGQHFTEFGYRIFDPLTRRLCGPPDNCAGQAYISDPFPGNVIPQNRISPIGAKILSYYPLPNTPNPLDLNNNFVAKDNLGRYYYNQPMGRWDHVAGSNDKFNLVVTYQKGYEFRSTTGFPKPAATGNTDNRRINLNYIANWTHVVSPTTVVDVRASYGRFTQITPGYNDEASEISSKDIGMTNMIHAPTYKDAVPAITASGYGRLFAGDNAISQRVDNQINFTPSVNMTRGRHNIRTGFEFNYVARGETSSGAAAGLFDFNAGWTQQRSGNQQNTFDGSTVASILLGYPASGRINYNDTSYRTRPYFAGYIQDDWKVNQLITLNLGFRYDVQVPWLERFDRSNRGFDPFVKNPLSDQVLAQWTRLKAEYDAANPNAKYPYPDPPAVLTGGFLFPGKDGQPRRLYDTDWTNIAPRVGIAWRLTPQGKTVIRAGVGLFYQSPTQLDTTTGYQQQTNYITTLNGIHPSAGASLTGPYSLAHPFPEGIAVPLGSSQGLLTNVGNGGISFDPPHFKIPRTYQYSFGFQHELPGSILWETSYTGNYQIFVNIGYDMNSPGLQNQLRAIEDPVFYSRTLPNPFRGLIPNNGSLGTGATIQATSLLRPLPLFNGGVTNNLMQNGRYRSDQLQTKLEKRMLGGGKSGVLTWVLSHTWAKAFEENHRLNSWNAAEPLIKELDNTDKAHSFAFSGVYDLPFRKTSGFLNGLVSDWRSSWILTYYSGNPTTWPDVVILPGCSWHAANQNENSWFNNDKNCYRANPTNNIRTVPDRFGDIRNPAVGPFLNMALEKTIPVSERYRFQLRGEAFNVTNSVQRPGPDTSFTSATFGQLPKSQLNFPRFFQLAAKFYF